MTRVACGIDFGTSNSTVGLVDSGGARLLALEAGSPTLPSAVFWQTEGAPPLFGRAAVAAYLEGDEGRLMRGLKSTLGSGLIHDKTAVGGRAVSFREVLGRFIGHLRAAQMTAAPELASVVLGRPVHFVDDDAAADAAAEAVLAEIARDCGWREVAFQYEPIAAALHYEQTAAREELVLIVDIGGGTSDVSVVRVGPGRAALPDRGGDILANDGIRAGGTDFDRLLSLAEALPHLGYLAPTRGGGTMPRHYYLDLATWHRINALYTARTAGDLKALRLVAERPELVDRMLRVVDGRHGHGLAMRVEAAKIALSDTDAARLQMADLTGGPNPMLRREGFEAAVEAPVARIGALLARVLVDAGVPADAIGTAFLTGGSSQLPILRATVQALLPGAAIATGDMLGSVGTGLALEARRRFG
ncbi:MAG: Hsp70 family protein [Tabrizicola sp.]|uniref:Hsp70 family protein n=1 Tax=Tabrizicola sp. TaxID=2005166 RepID=UPI002732CDDA|nr:Hsp70 family protein [Tabrizicola sp.]MDP3263346.1 Hsp70 family protein [Tabrizicola sp.]MDP3646703.1 Hsp70 family protein [Paracoccaceae bacterium]MDZ4067529.1 Hsp70 family protein [Tabrizicola sp.]